MFERIYKSMRPVHIIPTCAVIVLLVLILRASTIESVVYKTITLRPPEGPRWRTYELEDRLVFGRLSTKDTLSFWKHDSNVKILINVQEIICSDSEQSTNTSCNSQTILQNWIDAYQLPVIASSEAKFLSNSFCDIQYRTVVLRQLFTLSVDAIVVLLECEDDKFLIDGIDFTSGRGKMIQEVMNIAESARYQRVSR